MDNDRQLRISYPVDPQSLIRKTITLKNHQFELVSVLGMGAEKIVYGLKDMEINSISLVLKVYRKKLSKEELANIKSDYEDLKKYFGKHLANTFHFFIDDWPVEIQPYIDFDQPGFSLGASSDFAFSEGRESLKQIARLYEIGQFEQALAKCNIKLEEFPLHPNYLDLKGGCLLALNRVKEAIDVINLCIELEPDELRHHSNLEGAEFLLAVFTEAEHRNLSPEILVLKRLAATSLKNAMDVIDLHVEPEPNEPRLQINININFKRAVVLLRRDTAFAEVEHRSQLPHELLLQALVTMALIERYEASSVEAGRLLHETASDLQEHVRFTEAELLYQRAIEIREQHLGLEHPDVASSLNNLAILYSEQGKYAQAEPLLKRALFIQEQRLGLEHPSTQMMRKNYAFLLRTVERNEKAKKLEESS